MYYLANLRVLNDVEKQLYGTDVVLVYGKTIADAMTAIVKQYGDIYIYDVRIIPLCDYDSLDGVLLIKEDIDVNENCLLSSITKAVTLKCE
jgi:hypothetical protein